MYDDRRKENPGVLWVAGMMAIWPVGFKEGFFEIVIFNLTCEGRVGKVFLAEGTMHALK